MSQGETFNIRQMVDITGLSEFTIRGWENRYSAFMPKRSETGRRGYSRADVERALLLRELLKRGHKINKIAKLKNNVLRSLFVDSEKPVSNSAQSQNEDLALKAMGLLDLQKWSELEDLIHGLKSKNPIEVIQSFFLPSLRLLSARLIEGKASISQEHIFTSMLKEKIYSLISSISAKRRRVKNRKNITFVLAAPEGDHHEIGLLLAHLLIRANGYASIFLGPHTPSQDLAETALRLNASHILIAATVSKKQGARQDILNYIKEIQKRMVQRQKIWIAGEQAPYITSDENSQIFNISNFSILDGLLKNLEEAK